MHRVIAECWLLGLLDGHLAVVEGPAGGHSPTWVVDMPDRASPMDALAESAPVDLRGAPHSTSWRFVDGTIVLSFVAAPVEPATAGLRRIDPHPAPGDPHPAPAPAQPISARPAGAEPAPGAPTPDPQPISHERVVRHALRHVAFLMATDPAALGLDDPAWHAAGREHVPTVFRHLTDDEAERC